MTTKFNLDPRRPGDPFMRIGSYEIGGKIDLHDEPISIGHVAILHSAKVTITARITSIDGTNLTGEIIGFENYDDFEYCGKKPGDKISFTEADLHGLNL